MTTEFQLNPFIQYAALIVWAVSGTLVGQDRGFDIIGVFAIALMTSTGGGILRDGLFLQVTPWVVIDPLALPLVVVAVVLALVLTPILRRFQPGMNKTVAYLDAASVPAFAIVGFSTALAHELTIPGAIFVGLITGVGGGLIRDLLVAEVPALFRPGQFFALIAFLCVIIYAVLVYTRILTSNQAAMVAIAIAFVLRVLVIHFNWRTLPADAMTAQFTRSISRFPFLPHHHDKPVEAPPDNKIDN